MIAAIVVGWSMKRMDSRFIIGFGMIASAVTMWMMAGFTQDIERSRIVAINLVQGFAFSCFVIPVNTVAFSTLPGAQRDVGTSFYSLLNNIGRSLGIAYFATLFASTTQTARSTIVEQVTPFNDAVRHGLVPELWDHTTLRGLAALNREVVRQAELVAYVIDFELLAAIIIVCLPVLFLMGKPVQGSGGPN
jgi:DHA2 family multidrug resistance protein